MGALEHAVTRSPLLALADYATGADIVAQMPRHLGALALVVGTALLGVEGGAELPLLAVQLRHSHPSEVVARLVIALVAAFARGSCLA